MLKYDKIEYVGNAKYIVLNIYPTNKEVEVSKKKPYIFRPEDVIDARSLQYYKSLYKAGIRLHAVKVDSNEIPKVESSEVQSKVDDKKVENPQTPPKVEEVKEEVKPPVENKEVKVKDEVKVENNDPTEVVVVNNDELIEFLDTNFDDNSIRVTAKSAGIRRLPNNLSKMEIINKILDTNKDYVIGLLKSNS